MKLPKTMPKFGKVTYIVAPVVRQLPWIHNLLILFSPPKVSPPIALLHPEEVEVPKDTYLFDSGSKPIK